MVFQPKAHRETPGTTTELKPVILLSSWWRDSVMKMTFRNTVIGLSLSIGIALIIVSLVVVLNGIGLW